VRTLEQTAAALDEAGIDYELRVVDDGSSDDTAAVVSALAERIPAIRYVGSRYPRGFGFAVRYGLDTFEGDAVCVMMGDASDSPADVVAYHRLLESGYDCAFGSRFVRGARVSGYPWFKLALNRGANTFIRIVFRHGYNDTTNAFKAYRREVIETVQPLLSNHFNLTVELPLKAIVRGHSYGVIPISWTNRDEGVSKLKLQEMGSRYLFIVLYVFLEHHLSRGDYRRAGNAEGRLRPGLHGTAGSGGRAG
jgi:dolichol-phosphate mannosyltransferase